MRNLLFATTILSLISGCSVFKSKNTSNSTAATASERRSSSNIFGWAKKRDENSVVISEKTDPRGTIPIVTKLSSNRSQYGQIISVVGKVDRTGYYDLELVARNDGQPDENGILTYDFRAYSPKAGVNVDTDRSKEVNAAAFISNRVYERVRKIVVVASQNSASINR